MVRTHVAPNGLYTDVAPNGLYADVSPDGPDSDVAPDSPDSDVALDGLNSNVALHGLDSSASLASLARIKCFGHFPISTSWGVFNLAFPDKERKGWIERKAYFNRTGYPKEENP